MGGVDVALSDVRIRNAKPADKPYKLSDGEWLYLVVQPTGSKLWRLNYRFLGRQRTLAIGSYPEISLQAAREKRLEARKLLAQGVDPSEHKRAQVKAAKLAAANTFKAISQEYLDRVERQGLASETLRRKRWLFDRYINPKIGHRLITELRPSDLLEVLTDIERTNKLATARKARQEMGAVFRLAALTDRAMYDPTTTLQRAVRAPRTTSHPAIVHETGFGELMRRIATVRNSITRLALEFLAHTFVRPVELRLATWDEIDMEESVWNIPAERMKMRRPHDVPLSHAARTILRDIRRATRMTEGQIFPCPVDARKVMSPKCLSKALYSLGYKGKHSPHGFRSSAMTILIEKGYDDKVIDFQLAHFEQNETRKAYNRALYWDQRVQMMRDWADIIAELRGKAASGNE